MRSLPRYPGGPAALAILVLACGGDPEVLAPNPTPELGSIAVRWALQTEGGAPTTCAARGLAEAWVSVGRESVRVPCGEEERVVFSNLTFGTYPVVIRLRDPSGAVRAERVASTVLATRGVQDYTHTFVFSDQVPGAGRLRVQWMIDGEPAADACARAGGVDVRISTREGSIEPLSATVPCTAGEHLFEDLRSGSYQLILQLIDRIDRTISVRPTAALLVTEGQETTAIVGFSTGPSLVGNLRTLWTVGGRPPADRCPIDGTVEIQLRAPSSGGGGEIDIRTATARCTDGQAEMRDLGTSPVYQVRFRLFDRIPLTVSSTVVSPVRLTPAATTTVSIDLGLRD